MSAKTYNYQLPELFEVAKTQNLDWSKGAATFNQVKQAYDLAKKGSKNFTAYNETAEKLDSKFSLYILKIQRLSKEEQKRVPAEKKPAIEPKKPETKPKPATPRTKLPEPPAVPDSLIPNFQKIVDDMVLGCNVFLVGGAGTGKTTLAQDVAKTLGRQFMTINCSQYTAPGEIIGGQTIEGYQEGKLIEAWKNGYVLILDELPKIDPNTAGLFNDALAKSKIRNAVIFNSRKESFIKHPDFACIATGNVWPLGESMAYGANNKQDLSLLDRFAGSVYSIEKNPELEISVIGSKTLWQLCDSLRNAIEKLKYETPVSLRFMINARDSFMLQIDRKAKNKGLLSSHGKTLKDCFESFIKINFSKFQQEALQKETDNIVEFIASQRPFKAIIEELTESGFLKADGTLGAIKKRSATKYLNYIYQDGD